MSLRKIIVHLVHNTAKNTCKFQYKTQIQGKIEQILEPVYK